eukprot:4123689-Alexandrium_andersonii.AAC.1
MRCFGVFVGAELGDEGQLVDRELVGAQLRPEAVKVSKSTFTPFQARAQHFAVVLHLRGTQH